MGLYKIGRFLSVDPLFEMYTEFSPYNYCNNSPMMFRDPSGMGMEIALVGLGMIIYKYTADMIREAEYSEYGRVPNSAVPGGRIGDGGGGGSSGKGKNGVSAFTMFCHLQNNYNGVGNSGSTNADINLGYGKGGNNVYGSSHGSGYTDNGYVYSPLSIPESDVNISFGNSYVLGNNLSYAFNYSHVNNVESGYSIFKHPEYGYSFSSLIIGETDYMPFEFAISSITAKMLESGWKVAGSVHTHPSGKSFSMGDLGTILQDFGSPDLTPVVENNSFHIIEGAEYRYIIEVTNTNQFHEWGWFIKRGEDSFREGAKNNDFNYFKGETSNSYHRRLKKFLEKYNTGLNYNRYKK